MDDRKSWNRLIFAYSGVGLVVLTIGFFVARSASHNDFMRAHAGSTTASSVVGVYNGIQPDATASPAPTEAPSASPSPGASVSPSPTPRATPHATPPSNPSAVAAAAALALAAHHRAPKAHATKVIADTGATSDGASTPSEAAASHIVPIVHTAAMVGQAQPVQATPEPVATAAPAPPVQVAQASTQSSASDPIFAPERIVDAQVKVAVQPDESEADRERGAHGTSVVLVTIDPRGNVINAVVSSTSGYSTLDRAAISAARSSQFVAPKINGRPATETYRVVYDFGQ